MITKEQMLDLMVEAYDHFDSRSDIIDAIRALIESSGEKESGATIKCPECGNEIEGVTCPECKNYFELGPPPEECTCQSYFERTGSHVEDCPSFTKPAPSPGPSVEENQTMAKIGPPNPPESDESTWAKAAIKTGWPAPLPKEVEEAMFRMEMFANCHGSKDEVADAAVLKAALSAKEK